MRIGLPTGVVQSGVDETISALWSFANAAGLLTDNIGERTASAGVTLDHDLNVVGLLDLGADIELSSRTPASFSAQQNDFATGTETMQFLENTGVSNIRISGFAGGRDGRIIIITDVVGSVVFDLQHESTLSLAANRIQLPAASLFSVGSGNNIILYYDGTRSRWITVATGP